VTNGIVALKRINTKQEENGFPITAIREVKILKALNHPNVVKLLEIVTSKGRWLDVVVECWNVGGHSFVHFCIFIHETAHSYSPLKWSRQVYYHGSCLKCALGIIMLLPHLFSLFVNLTWTDLCVCTQNKGIFLRMYSWSLNTSNMT
jgi:serine/threonine protein kinase